MYWPIKSNFIFLLLIIFFTRVRYSWNIADDRNLFLKVKSKLGFYQIVFTTPKTSSENYTLAVVEMQQLQYIEKIDSKEKICFPKRTFYTGRRKVCVNFKTDTDKLNFVLYRFWKKNVPQKEWNLLQIERIPDVLSKTSLSIELHLHISQAVHCIGWSNSS